MSADLAGADPAGRAAAVTALATLTQFADANVGGVMLITQQKPQPPAPSQVLPTDKALPSLNAVIRAAANDYAACEVIDYEAGSVTVGDQVMWLPVASVPLLKTIADDSADLANLDPFDPGTARLSDLQLAAMRAEANGLAAVFVQSLRGNQVVAQSRRVGVLVKRGVVDVPDGGEILLFTKDVAAVILAEVAFFQDRLAFQRLFGYLEELRQRASATFQTVISGLRIEGVADMATAVTGSPAMLGKMASIQRKLDQYPQYRAALTMPKLVAFVRDHPECGVDIAGTGDDERLVFRNDPQHRFKILKLLDDDYLRSELTNLGYEANSKSAPIG